MNVYDKRKRLLRDVRISVIDSCNFRCGYCMPEESSGNAPKTTGKSRLSFPEISEIVDAFVHLGVEKIRLTGGEPLLRRNLPKLIEMIARRHGDLDIALTTNGSMLAKLAAELRASGLKRLTVSLDTLDPERFFALSGRRGRLEDVLLGIRTAESAGFESIKINCVVQSGINDADVLAIADYFRWTRHIVRFIEFMDVGTCNRWDFNKVVPSRELLDRIAARWPLVAMGKQYPGEVANRYRYQDGAGEIGFISSVSQPFCGDCNRARVSASGDLYTCLFGHSGTSLRPFLANDKARLITKITEIWRARDDRYSELRGIAGVGEVGEGRVERKRIEMYMIGG